jgi:hypothetical protein
VVHTGSPEFAMGNARANAVARLRTPRRLPDAPKEPGARPALSEEEDEAAGCPARADAGGVGVAAAEVIGPVEADDTGSGFGTGGAGRGGGLEDVGGTGCSGSAGGDAGSFLEGSSGNAGSSTLAGGLGGGAGSSALVGGLGGAGTVGGVSAGGGDPVGWPPDGPMSMSKVSPTQGSAAGTSPPKATGLGRETVPAPMATKAACSSMDTSRHQNAARSTFIRLRSALSYEAPSTDRPEGSDRRISGDMDLGTMRLMARTSAWGLGSWAIGNERA